MSALPCKQVRELCDRLESFAETPKPEARAPGDRGFDESEFYAECNS